MKKEKVRCESADEIFPDDDSAPDFLSLDTEGSEYEILQGSPKLLRSTVLAVRSEVLFTEFRKNQKMFSDIYNYLIPYGFHYVGMDNYYPMYYAKSLDYVRGAGFAFAADAFFIKDYHTIVASKYSPERKVKILLKLAAISLCFNLLDYAYQILEVVHVQYHQQLRQQEVSYKYVRLCKDYYREYNKLMKKYFPRQKYYASNHEFWGAAPEEVAKENPGFKKNPTGKSLTHILLRRFLKKSHKVLLMRALRKGAKGMAIVYYHLAPKDKLELILYRYGLREQAKAQKRFRSEHLFTAKKIARNALS